MTIVQVSRGIIGVDIGRSSKQRGYFGETWPESKIDSTWRGFFEHNWLKVNNNRAKSVAAERPEEQSRATGTATCCVAVLGVQFVV